MSGILRNLQHDRTSVISVVGTAQTNKTPNSWALSSTLVSKGFAQFLWEVDENRLTWSPSRLLPRGKILAPCQGAPVCPLRLQQLSSGCSFVPQTLTEDLLCDRHHAQGQPGPSLSSVCSVEKQVLSKT